MKSFSTAYYTSRKDVRETNQATVMQEHAKIIAAMKKEFGVNSFSSLNESEQKAYTSLLLELWNKETGLTEKGIKFLNEAYAPLTPDSTPEQVKKAFQRDIKANIKDYVISLGSENSNWEDASKIKKRLESELGHKISNKDCKTWMYEVISKYLADKIRSYKF